MRHFAIVPVDCDAVILLPENEAEREEWVKLNWHLFFSGRDRNGQRPIGYGFTTSSEGLTVDGAIEESARQIATRTIGPLRDIAYDETEFERLVHIGRGYVIPLYDTVRQLVAGDYELAVISLLLDAASVAPVIGSAFKHARKAGRWLRRAVKFAEPVTGALPKGAGKASMAAQIAKSAKASPGVGESVRTMARAGTAADSPAVREGLRELRQFIDDHRAQLQQFIDRPLEQCEAAMTKLFELMSTRYGKRIHARGMYIFDHKADYLPANHFAVRVRIGETDYVVDLTAGQFRHQPRGMKIDGPIIDTEQAWARKYRDAAGGRLIKYEDFEQANVARNTFTSQAQMDPADVIPGATILNQPDWHKGLKPIVIKPRHRPGKRRRYHVRGHRHRP